MRIKQTVIGIAIVAGLLGLAGCQRIDPKAEAQIRPAVAGSRSDRPGRGYSYLFMVPR